MALISFIPVRGGSKSIPLKNIRDFCGQPLVYWNIKALQECTLVDHIVVATDSEAIKEVVSRYKFNKVIIYDRTAENAQDTSSTESVMLEYLQVANHDDKDIFMLVQATSPLTQEKDFSKAITQYYSGDYDSLLTCVRVKSFFWSEEGIPINYDYKKKGLVVRNLKGCFRRTEHFILTL